MKHMIDICCITDEGYTEATKVLVSSLKKSGNMFCMFLLVPMGCKVHTNEPNIHVIHCDFNKISGLHYGSTNHRSAILKFLIPHYVPISRVLYLDTDLIVRGGLDDLWSVDLEDNYVGAVTDMWIPVSSHERRVLYPRYFNSGVMLMNLDLMRKDNVMRKLIWSKKEIEVGEGMVDQDAFNDVCYNRVKSLDIKWNFLPVCYELRKDDFNISDMNEVYDTSYSSMEELVDDPMIVHWAGKLKPWMRDETLFMEEWRDLYYEI